MKTVLEDLTPKQIVEQLDTYIIGQKSEAFGRRRAAQPYAAFKTARRNTGRNRAEKYFDDRSDRRRKD